jgi:hypothetical protein
MGHMGVDPQLRHSGLPDLHAKSSVGQHQATAQTQHTQQPVPEKHKEKPVPDNVRQFALKHYKEAQTLAASLGNGVTAAEILAIAGNETGWGDPKSHAQYGNFFGMHGKGPAGTHYAKKTQAPVQIFSVSKDNDGFLASGQAFVKLVQDRKLLTPGVGDNPKAFFDILNRTGLLAVGEHPGTYGAFMVGESSNRGPFTLVTKCINQLQ